MSSRAVKKAKQKRRISQRSSMLQKMCALVNSLCAVSSSTTSMSVVFILVAQVRSPLLQQIESLRMALGMDLWDPDSGQGRDPWAPTGFSGEITYCLFSCLSNYYGVTILHGLHVFAVEGWKLPVAFCAAPFGNQVQILNTVCSLYDLQFSVNTNNYCRRRNWKMP
eukprot:SAG31_NODE_1688_length_7528_cov_14.515143_2_plen_166_part_00